MKAVPIIFKPTADLTALVIYGEDDIATVTDALYEAAESYATYNRDPRLAEDCKNLARRISKQLLGEQPTMIRKV